jgi:lysozyme
MPGTKKIWMIAAVGALLLLGIPGGASAAENIIIEFEVGSTMQPYLTAVPDARGYYQAGFGSIYDYDLGRLVQPGDQWDLAKSYRMMRKEISKVANFLDSHVTVPINQNQRNALLSFGYNVGTGADGLGGSKLLRLLNAGADKYTVADQFQYWRIADGRINNGLVNRRQKEKELFLS